MFVVQRKNLEWAENLVLIIYIAVLLMRNNRNTVVFNKTLDMSSVQTEFCLFYSPHFSVFKSDGEIHCIILHIVINNCGVLFVVVFVRQFWDSFASHFNGILLLVGNPVITNSFVWFRTETTKNSEWDYYIILELLKL